ncbi:prephenate dehydrogenase/arogenate dehydrogenase family protein [Archangium primigenium]|uniref:prephenate dehydrogenase/arogenate dehydrogenase family protein n=1 Tax=[Archangium] primigenium TaxID=2792470 RepID=UPI00195B7E36|nr:prephenate dehydrogenase/arogenate dehydrogenase family protein [Archangium primigenium]MBM7119257.1 prephenate dehydrogenase/arogenate dehydrogenase family protein [Archangium primigenium]
MTTVAIVGFGRFGRALGGLLEEAQVPWRAWDPVADIPAPHRAASSREALRDATHVVVAVPVALMRHVLLDLSPALRPEQLVMDVGSVKVRPVQALTEVLGTRVPWVGTHPLFGPLSLAMAERPLHVVLCPNPLHPEAAARARAFYERLGCELIEQSPEGHDRVMAHTHALTFFVAKGMVDAGSGVNVPFAPASFRSLSRTIQLVRSDAGHLFSAIQHENPFAREARGHLLEALQNVHRELDAQPAEVGFPEEPPLAPPALETGLPELQETRALIDQVDQELVALLARRAELARRALKAKAQAGQPVPDPAREEAMLGARREWAQARGLEPDGVEALFRAILRFSRRAQQERSGPT